MTFVIVPDDALRSVIRGNLEANPPQDQIGFFQQADRTSYQRSPEPNYQQIRQEIDAATFVIVGVTGRDPNEFWALEAAAEHQKPYGLILQTEDLAVWAMMSLTHRFKPFKFVIGLGKGPRKADSFFKGARVFTIYQPEHYRLGELIELQIAA